MLRPDTILDGKYRVDRLLGEGGMGAVFEAEQIAIQRPVAIKVLFAGLAHDPEAVARFHREAKAAGRIGHDNICEVTDIGVLPTGSPYLVMPLLRGRPLSRVIAADAPLALDRAVNLAAQMLDGLAAAHAAHIVHRDIKPDNVFVTQLGATGMEFVKILDFGISKILGSVAVNDRRQVTKTGMVLGTPCYMAPEQARGRKSVDHRVDVYAVGVILYEMLTGKRPFDGETYNEILVKVVVDPFLAPRAVCPEIPEAIEAVILAAMERDHERRYQSAPEFRRELLFATEIVKGVHAPVAGAMPRAAAVRGISATLPAAHVTTPRAAGADPTLGASAVLPPRRRGLWLGLAGAA
ncbi:MAG: serine/threonine-protein kinase, partial [Myxococcota bacterium]|nr:serine/threonine-protein kinase [Myxococcota bacterium]